MILSLTLMKPALDRRIIRGLTPPARHFGFALFFILGLAAPDARADGPTRVHFVVAHRGLLLHAPENTLPAFRACLELRIGFELDVRRTQDGHLVCLHDETLDRTTNGRGQVSAITLAEFQRLDAGSWFDPAFHGEPPPTIDDVFRLIAQYPAHSRLIAVDMKAADEQVEQDVVALARRHQVLDRLLFIGRTIDHPEVRHRLRAADATVHTAALAARPEELAAAIADRDATWVYLRYVPSREEVARIHQAGKPVFLAGPTVAGHETANWRAAVEHGVDGILTDYPLELRRVLRGASDQASE
jgi:glycerophosphoryl diester phosphodiesterase